MKGAYVLVMELQNEVSLLIGGLGWTRFQKGYYVYVGSALNGLEQRIQRHLRSQKKTHWHIDYLLPSLTGMKVFYKESSQKEECRVAQEFVKDLGVIPGFGCSDCSCLSHLFFGSSQEIDTIIDSLGMKPYPADTNP